MRTLFEQGEIALPKNDKLLADLCNLKYKYLNGKMLIEKKEELKKRGLPSPDRADALMYCFLPQAKTGLLDFAKQEMDKEWKI